MDDVVDPGPLHRPPVPDDPARVHFADNPVALAVLGEVRDALDALDLTWTERVTRSQVAFRAAGPSGRERGFAWLWDPELYLRRSDGPLVVLTVGLDRPLDSPRVKESARPSAHRWVHHVEVHDPSDLDDDVLGWLAEAALRLP